MHQSTFKSTLFSLGVAALLALPAGAALRGEARVYRPEPGEALTVPSRAPHRDVIGTFLRAQGRSQAAVDGLVMGDANRSARHGITHHRASQVVDGLRVWGAYAKVAIDDQGRVVHAVETLVNPRGRVAPARIGTNEALDATFGALYHGRRPDFYRQPAVERVAIPGAGGSLAEGFLVETWTNDDNLLHHTLIGGDGEVLDIELRTNDDSYNVYTDNPDDTNQAIVSGPGAGNAESPDGWLYASGQNTYEISGNNVSAYLDSSNSNSSDGAGTPVTGGDFTTAYDDGSQPTTANNKAVAVQNLFYLNNVIHDRLYRHGFTEAAGNFQENNFGNGGAGSDSVNAEAQDGSGSNNANFSTPSDGSNPRMQMYLFDGIGDHLATVNGTSYLAMGAEFGPTLSTSGVNGALAVANDGSGTTSDACESMSGLAGKIAVIDRGTCDFVTKVKNAQNAGAVGAIVANNAGDGILTMGGTDNTITIPSVFVGQTSGVALKAAVTALGNIAANPNPPLMKDGDFDSDIVYHEYGHGLTWRMIGSMSGAMSGAIGEGMGDVLSFMMNGRPTVGTYAVSDSRGIRREPYDTYSLTYGDFSGSEVHDDGEIYAAAVWNVREKFIAAGVDLDSLWDYLVDGMNYTPAGPDMDDMRDGVLQSAINAGLGHECLIWNGYAEGGIGEGAFASKRGPRYTVTESFAVPAACSGPQNIAPTASFTFDCTGLSCSFDGSGSTDSDGTITGYSWSFGDGGSASGATANHTFGGSSSYTVTLTVTDDGGATDDDVQSVPVSDGNAPPTASFTFVCTDLDCDFDGTASADSDGSIVSYAWSFGDGGSATGALVSHAYGSAGTRTVTLTVTDDGGATGGDAQSVTVSTSGGGDTTPPVISDVASVDGKGNKFTISWTTDEPATSVITIGTQVFTDTALVTSHSREFNGSKGALYSYTVSSTDAAGNTSTAGPYEHQN